MLRTFLTATVIAAAFMAGTAESHSQTAAQKPDIATELIVGDVSIDGDPFKGWVGVRVRLGPGWKIYWKAPGDAGLPPEFDWSASSNVAEAAVHWPVPHRTSILGVESIGYTEEVLFPVELLIEDPDFEAKAELKLALYACSTICIREERVLAADLAHPSSPDAQSLIEEWQSKVPHKRSASLSITSAKIIRSTPPRIRVETASAQPLVHPDLFVAGARETYAVKPDIQISGQRTMLTSILQHDPTDPSALSNLEVTLTDGLHAVQALLPPSEVLPSPASASHRTTADTDREAIWIIFATALLGGLILNLMPCVFPVLSLKLLSFVNHQPTPRRSVRMGLAASVAGVVASFLALASVLVVLKAGGTSIGWGVQFQQPLFLAVMAVVITLFAANLLGLFEISLPHGLMNALARNGVASSIPSQFANGFATALLATPCSAPFVGTAVSFALSRGGAEIYSVFAALGVGMAVPYLLIACVPNLATLLPHPGSWMLWLRRTMALPLLGTVAWLTTLIGATAGLFPASLMATALVVGLLVLWWRATQPSVNPTIAVSSVLFVVTAAALVALVQLTRVTHTQAREIQWRPFTEAR